jgi:hypothetical protein
MSEDESSLDGSAWAWATEHGAPEWASTEQLLCWLARGELPACALVWKHGWGEWLPAMQVAELAAAFPNVTPGSRRVARAAAESAPVPPAFPVEHYPRLRLLTKDVMAESPLPAPGVMPPGLEPAQAGRSTLRDLDLLQKDVVTSQVPAAAMLEAARAMQRPDNAPPSSSAERWSRLELERFSDAPLPATAPALASAPAPRDLSPLAVELGFPKLLDTERSENRLRPSTRYGRWIVFGTLLGSALGLLSVRAPEFAFPMEISALLPALPRAPESPLLAAAPAVVVPPPAAPAVAVLPAAPAVAEEQLARVAAAAARKAAGIVQVKHNGEPAVLQALRMSKNVGFDRVVFEFRERVPGYRLEYIDAPVRDCAAGAIRSIAGDGWLQARFSPASAHTEDGASTVRTREFKPALSMVREVERTCDFEGVVTWVVGTASPRHYRAYELASPPRLVVEIDQ